jgi:opacity protein-like surface antigen
MTAVPSGAFAQCVGDVNNPFSAFAPAASSVITAINGATSVVSTINTAFSSSGPAFLASTPNGAPGQQSGGVWTRAVGGTVETKADANFGLSLTVTQPVAPTSFPVTINASCKTSVKQGFAGFEAGHDIAVLHTGNSDLRVGGLVGYVGAKADAPPNTSGALQSANFAAPSAGIYAAYSRGAFSADVQGRLYRLEIEGLDQRLDASGYSFAGNASYRFDLPGNWTIEPSIGGIFSRTSFNPLFVADAATALGVSPSVFASQQVSGFALSSSFQIHDVESVLGRASVKLGTRLPLDGTQIVAYPFVTASVFHEFEGNVLTSITMNGSLVPPVGRSTFQGGANLTSSGLGTYGQFGAGSAFQLGDTGWLSYARVDYRTGEFIHGVSGSAGLRYQFDDPGHATANHAGYPVKAPKAAPAEGYDWTGPYAGVFAGGTWGSTHWATQGGNADPDYAGVLGGGQAGYNYQTGRFVWGIEGDGGWSNARGAAGCLQPLIYSCLSDVSALGSLAGRFGYTWGRTLFYAKGGWAFGEVTAGTSLNFGASPHGIKPAQSTNWENGWTVGAGMEFALTDRWSVKAEYMHYGFPGSTFTVAQGMTASVATAGDTARIGLNYHFSSR